MGKITEIKPTKLKQLPDKLYVVKEFDEDLGDVLYLAFDHISCIQEGDVVGVYDLSDIKKKYETHSLV